MKNVLLQVFTSITMCLCLLTTANAATIYVNHAASGNNDGTSSADAYTDLQDGLDGAAVGDEVWVAAGTYLPTESPDGVSTNNRDKSFHFDINIEVYGGFAGTETMLSQRDVSANPTILSADLGVVNDNTDNAYHILITEGLSTAAVIDGFTLTGANADGTGSINYSSKLYNQERGGGIFNYNSDPSVSNCIFINNSVTTGGGGMYNLQGAPVLTNCIFDNNYGGTAGGAISTIVSNPTFTNCVFSNNSTGNLGGAVYNHAAAPNVINCTFSGNSATGGGGAMYNNVHSAIPVVHNTVFHGNTVNGVVNDIAGTNVNASSSHNASDGTGANISAGTGFVTLSSDPFSNSSDPDGADDTWGTSDDGLALASGSPLLGTGTATGAPTNDVTGTARPNPPSIGAYELFSASTPTTSSTVDYALEINEINGQGGEYVSTTNPNFYSDDFTMEGWFNTTKHTAGIVSVYQPVSNSTFDFTGLQINHLGELRMTMNIGSNSIDMEGTTVVNDGNWHHFALVRRADDKLHLYIDGAHEMSSSNSIPDIGNTAAYTVEIGRVAATTGRYFGGQMDNIRLWSRELSVAEISTNYTTPFNNTTSDPDLVVNYDFNGVVVNGVIGTNIPDESGNSNVGTLQNGATVVPSTTPVSTTSTTSFDVDFDAQPVCASATEWLVPITVGAVPSDVGAVSLVFDYDATKMTYSSVESFNSNLSGADATNTGTLIVNDNNGKITVSWAGNPAAALANATILTLKFVPANSAADFTASAGTTAAFTWDNSDPTNNELADNMAAVMTATFNAQSAATIHALLTAGLSSDKSNDEICAGETITFTATGGTSYRFLVDGAEAQAASADDTYDTDALTNGQVVTVEVTDANGCTATSTGITVTVNALPTPGLASSDADNSICTGESVTFTASGADEYIFQVDGATVQAQSATATYTTTSLTDGQVVSVIGVTTATGCQAASATTFTMTVISCYEYAGELVYKNTAETYMGNVALTLTEAGGATYNATTSLVDGTFSFTDLPGGSYTLSYATGKTVGSINSTDALMVILHAINLLPLNGLNKTAGDVNDDGTETATDALLIQRRFTGVINSFTAGDWAFENPTIALSSDMTNQKINALVYGDVNGSYTPNSTENSQPTVFFVGGKNIQIADGQNVTIPIAVADEAIMGAISLSINLPTNGMTINDVKLPNGQSLMYTVNGNELRIAWADLNALNLSSSDVVFNIEATVIDAQAMINNTMTLNDFSEIADDNAAPYALIDLVLPTFSSTSTSTNTVASELLSLRHYPNPFRGKLTIEYNLPTTSEVAITVTNALGQTVTTLVNETQAAGQQQVKFDAKDLVPGVYFYRIDANDGNNHHQITQKVLLMK